MARSFRWETLASMHLNPPSSTLPPLTLAAASRRISLVYQNVIFKDTDEELGHEEHTVETDSVRLEPEGHTTAITWPATTQGGREGVSRSEVDITFLRPSASVSRVRSQYMTQDTQDTGSYDYSDASSIAHFPAFHFSLHSLTTLATLITESRASRAAPRGSRKVNLLVAVLEVEGPESIRIKKGPDAGKEVSLLKLVLGDETGGICKLSAWRSVAEEWVGLNSTSTVHAVKKGDIVFLENVLASWEADTTGTVPVNCSASPHLKSKMDICYRAMPSVSQDARLRPDLRLGLSDALVRKVASVVKWFEGMAGLS